MSNDAESSGQSAAEQMPALAQQFVAACKTTGIALDFLPRTLPLVDRFMKSSPSANARGMAAYVGEVIRRETGGRWYDFEDELLFSVGDYTTDPVAIVTALCAGGRAQEGDITIESTKAYCELICRMQRLWLDGTVLGDHESMAELRTSMTPDAKTAGWLVGQAQNAVKTAKMQWQESLDFSADSLDAMERILSALNARSQKTGAEGLTDQQLADAANMWGVYVGEVIRRVYGGQWSTAEDGALQISLSGTTPQPIVKVRKRIVDGAMDNIRVWFYSFPKALRS